MEKVQYPYPIDTFLVDSKEFYEIVKEDTINFCYGIYKEGARPDVVKAQRKLLKFNIGDHKRFYYSYTRNIFYVEGL
jgi:hypothetical protein